MSFKFNVQDTQNIPGLTRPWDSNTPFLTPVFFDLNVLIKYFYDPRYNCEFYGETYGKIEGPEEAEHYSYFPFGINPNNKVIAWLGDITRLNSDEQLYLQSHNVASDGNIDSEFYNGQIGIEFAEPIREVELVLFKSKISDQTKQQYNFPLYKTTNHSISEIVSYCSKYKRIIFNNEDDIKRFLSIWNEDLIEDLNVEELKNILKEKGIKFDSGVRGLKLLEKFIIDVLGISENIIAPLFYLYDLRLWADHREMQAKYDDTLSHLGLDSNAPFSEVYKTLIHHIYEFYKEINSRLLK